MTVDELGKIFFPYHYTNTTNYKKSGYPFAYYTDADTALKIIRSQSVWMRKPSMMNDYSEVEHGFLSLNTVLNSNIGKEFRAALDITHSGLSARLDDLFPQIMANIRATIYIACFTKHSPLEDNYGRLSMWRAYGKNSGIALIFKPEIFLNKISSDVVGVLSSPVAYLSFSEIGSNLKRITENIKKNATRLKNELTAEVMLELLLMVYESGIIFNKHKGFEEEQEWRAITSDRVSKSPLLLKKTVEVIKGTPQTIQSFNLKNHPELGITGLSFNDLLKRIIIGPCEHPEATREALILELTERGYINAKEIIHISNIPLRLS